MVFLLPARFDCQRLGSANGLVQRTFRAIGYLAHSLWGYGGYWNGSGYGSAYQNSNNAWWGNRMLADGGIDQNVDVSPESLIGIYNATVDEELGKVDEVVDAIAYSGHRPTLDINADTGGALIQSGRSADTLPPGTQGMMPQDDSRSLKPVEGLAEELGFAAAKNSARTDRELNAVSSSGANTAQMFSEEARSGEAAAEAGPVTLELESRKEGQIPVEVVKDLIEKGLATVVQATDHERSWGEWWRNHPGRDVPSKEYVAVSDVFGDEIRTLVLELVPYRAAQHHHGRLMTGTTPARDAHYKIVDSGQGQALTLNSSQYGTLDRSRVEEILAQRRAKDYSEVVADLYHDRLTERKLANRAAIAEFTLHMIPLGAAADYASQGDFKEAGISLVGDAATLIGGPLTRVAGFAKYTKAVKAAKISAMVLEGGIGAERLREGWAIYSKTGDASQAAGYFGEAALRLLGVSAQAASKIKPANVLKIKPANALAPVVKKIS